MPGKIDWLEVELIGFSALERFSVSFGDCTRSEIALSPETILSTVSWCVRGTSTSHIPINLVEQSRLAHLGQPQWPLLLPKALGLANINDDTFLGNCINDFREDIYLYKVTLCPWSSRSMLCLKLFFTRLKIGM